MVIKVIKVNDSFCEGTMMVNVIRKEKLQSYGQKSRPDVKVLRMYVKELQHKVLRLNELPAHTLFRILTFNNCQLFFTVGKLVLRSGKLWKLRKIED